MGEDPERAARADEPREAEFFTDFVHARRKGLDKEKMPNDKLGYPELGAACGVATPRRYGVWRRTADIDLVGLPERFVIKPTRLSFSRGVLLLRRVEPGLYEDLRLGGTLGEGDVVSSLESALLENPRRANSFIAEELVIDEDGSAPPIDYKVFLFGGRIVFIEHVRRHGRRSVRFYGDGFTPFALDGRIWINRSRIEIDAPRLPRCADELLAAARRLAAHLRTPFVRVDLYAGRSGPVLGEITRAPGGAYYGGAYMLTEAFDRELGALWAAEARALGERLPKIAGMAPSRALGAATETVSALDLRILRGDLRAAERDRRRAEAEAERLRRALAAAHASTSWRLTAPLRAVARPLAGLRRRLRARRPPLPS